MAAANTIQGWRLPICPLPASSLCCGGIHIHYVAPLTPSFSVSLFSPLVFFFLLQCTSFSFSNFPHYLTPRFSLSPCLCGPPLGWLLLAAPVPPTLSLDMLFIGLQRGWLSVQGGCCLKQCSLNKKKVRSSQRALWLTCSHVPSLFLCTDTKCTIHPPLLPFLLFATGLYHIVGFSLTNKKKELLFSRE